MTIVQEVPISVTVLSADSTGTRIRWSRGVTTITDVDAPIVRTDPAAKPMLMQAAVAQAGPLLSAMDNLTFELNFDAQMRYAGLTNQPEVRAAAVKTLDAMDEMRRKNGNPPLDAALREQMTGKNIIEQVMPKEALTYLSWSQHQLSPGGKPLEIQTDGPNPLGGRPLSVTAKVTFDAAPDPQGRPVVRIDSTLGGEQLAKMIDDAAGSTPAGKPLTDEERQAVRAARVSTTAEYHIDATTGLPTAATQRSTVNAGSGDQWEEYAWTIAPAAPATR